MLPENFIAAPFPGGWTYTLVSRLGEMLSLTEEKYGPRDMTWTILGVELCRKGPKTWLPGFEAGRRHVIVQLHEDSQDYPQSLLYELAHESVHLLSPGPSTGTTIEEGCAELFAREYMAKVCFEYRIPTPHSYDDAVAAVGELLAIDGAAVKRLRAEQPSFDLMTAQTFAAASLAVPAQLVERLLAPAPDLSKD